MNLYMLFAVGLYLMITQKVQDIKGVLSLVIPTLGLSYYMGTDNQSWLFFAGLLFMNIVTMVMKL
jgi:hypothetical protein